MAESKKSIVVYADWEATFEQLSDEEAGKLIKHFFKYVNDKNPVMEDRILKIAFEPIKQQLKRDLKKWERTKEKKSDAGKAGMAKRWGNPITPVIPVIPVITDDNTLYQDITNITVTVNDTVNDIKKEKEKNFPIMPKAEDVGELPEVKVKAAIELMKITKQTDISAKDVVGLWNVFKIQNLTGEKYHPNLEAVHSYFINWIKTQNIKQSARASPYANKSSAPPLRTVEYYD